MKLSLRLLAIVNLIDKDQVILDIGTDHGLLPIYAIKQNIAKLAIASDIKEQPLKQALKNIKQAELEQKIKLVLSDGLDNITSFFNTIIIAGVGPRTIINILENNLPKIKGKKLILQSNVSTHLVREWLNKHRFKITDEQIVYEKKNYYEIIKAKPGLQILSSKDLYLGPKLKNTKDQKIIDYYDYLIDKYSKVAARIPKKQYDKKQEIETIINIYKKR